MSISGSNSGIPTIVSQDTKQWMGNSKTLPFGIRLALPHIAVAPAGDSADDHDDTPTAQCAQCEAHQS